MIQSLDCIVVFKMLLAVDAKRGGLGGQLLREQVWALPGSCCCWLAVLANAPVILGEGFRRILRRDWGAPKKRANV
jgi:hypothetical protein